MINAKEPRQQPKVIDIYPTKTQSKDELSKKYIMEICSSDAFQIDDQLDILEAYGNKEDFLANAAMEGKTLAEVVADKIIAAGKTQIGKQTIQLNQSWEQYNIFFQVSRRMGIKNGTFLNFDIACASRRSLLDKKREDHENFLNDLTFQKTFKFFDFVLHNDCLQKALKNPSRRCLKCYVYIGDSGPKPYFVSINDLIAIIDKYVTFTNVQLDEFHQYKRKNGAIHKFLKILDVKMSQKNRKNCKLLMITATPFDTMAYINELSLPPELFFPKYLNPPPGYYSFVDFQNDGMMDDLRPYMNSAKKKYKDDKIELARHQNHGVYEYFKDHYSAFMKDPKKFSCFARHPYKNEEKQQHLIELLNLLIEENRGKYGDCSLYTPSSKEGDTNDRRIFESRVGLSKEEIGDDIMSLLGEEVGQTTTKKKAIFLAIGLYDVGVSIKTEDLYTWLEPLGDSHDSTYIQRAGRGCGSDKRGNNMRLAVDERRIMEVEQSYMEYAENDKEVATLAIRTSGVHKTYNVQRGIYEHYLVDEKDVKPLWKPSKGQYVAKVPYDLSKRGTKLSKDKVKLIQNGKLLSPTGLVLKAINSILEGNGKTVSNIVYPNEYGGEFNCVVHGQNRYGTKILGPCIYASTEEKEAIKPYIGQVIVSNWSGRNSRTADPDRDPTVLGMTKSMQNRNCLADKDM